MNDDFYKEEFFYSQNGSPTEIYNLISATL